MALKEAGKIGDSIERLRVDAAIALGMGEAWLPRDPGKALGFLRSAQAFYGTEGDQFELPRTFLAQYRAYSAAGNSRQAGKIIDQSISWYESQVATIADLDLGESYVSSLDKMFDAIVQSEVTGGHFEAALRYAERRRALLAMAFATRSVSLELRKQAAELSLQTLSEFLPKDVTLIAYITLPEGSVAWRIGHREVVPCRLAAGSREISRLVDAYYRSLSDKAAKEGRRELLGEIYEKVVGPVLAGGRRGGRLLVVPAGDLARVPFSATLDRRTRRYLIQDFSVEMAPSVTWVLRCLQQKEHHAVTVRRSILAVGDPKINRNILPDLPNLALSVTEARQIRALYPEGVLLLGEAATKDRVLQVMPTVSIVHIGAHAISNRRAPGKSFIALSPASAEDTGLLRAQEISGTDLSSIRMIVLSACGGANGMSSHMDSLNLVEPFLGAGAHSVVASLWDIGDGLGVELFPIVHKKVLAGEPPAEALRVAQLDLLLRRGGSLQDPAQWGSMAAFGV